MAARSIGRVLAIGVAVVAPAGKVAVGGGASGEPQATRTRARDSIKRRRQLPGRRDSFVTGIPHR